MDSKEDILFKKPSFATKDESGSKNDDHKQLIAEQVSQKEVKSESVSRTVLPEPMTQLCPPDGHYFIDQLKNGVIVDHKAVVKPRIVFGRAQDCDVVLEHPSVSRYHAVLLWSPISDEDFRNGLKFICFYDLFNELIFR